MPSTSSTDARCFSGIEYRTSASRAEFAGTVAVLRQPRLPPRPRPKVPLVHSLVDTGDDHAASLSHRSSTARTPSHPLLRRIVEILLVAFVCVCAAFVIWLSQDDASCGPKLFRDPVTGRMTSYGTQESRKQQILCARLGYPDSIAVPVE
ncbi:hypothetical protein SAMN05519104_2430 [Rhizobiales bacterium GAS188]|nr:hypothetical protein SAMN05519104_2430 [Rhizobiales bacterium GAS188]